MAETTEVTILDFQIKDDELISRIAAAKQQAEELRAANKNLTAEIKSLVKANQELAKDELKNAAAIEANNKAIKDKTAALTKNELQIKEVGKSEKALKNVLEQSNKATEDREGSIAALRKQLSTLTKEYNGLSREERNNVKVGGELKKQIDAVTDELKEQSTQLDQQKLNVGNYTESIKEAIEGINFAGISIGSLTQNFTSVSTTIQGFTKSVTASRGALVALAAVPIVLVLIGIVAVLSKLASATDFVGDKLEQFGAGFGAVFDFLTTALNEFISNFDFSELIDSAIADFVKFNQIAGKTIVKFLTGDFKGALNEVGKVADTNFGKLVSGAGKAFSAQAALTEQLQDLKDQEEAIALAQARANAQAEKAIVLSKDRTRSESTRIGLLKSSNKDLEAAANLEIDQLRKILNIKKQELELRTRTGKDISGNLTPLTQEIQKAERALIEAVSNFDNLRERNQNKINALIEEGNRLREQAAEAEAAFNRELSTNRANLLEDEFAKRRKLLEIAQKEELRSEGLKNDKLIKEGIVSRQQAYEAIKVLAARQAKERGDLELQIEKELSDKRIAQYKEQIDYEAEQRAKIEKKAEDKKKADKIRFEEGLAIVEASAAKARMDITRKFLAGEIKTRGEYNDQMDASERIRLQARKNFLIIQGKDTKEARAEILAIEKELLDKEISDQERALRSRQLIREAEFQAAKSFVDGMGSLFEILAGSQEDATELQKALALVQIGIDTAKAISTLVPTSVKVAAEASSVAGPAAPAVYAAVFASTLASGIASIASNIAQAKQLLQFEQGGAIDPRGEGITLPGKRHRDGGTKIFIEGRGWIEAEKGELLTIVKRTDSAKLSRLSNLNVSRGGRPFYELGGSLTVNAAQQSLRMPEFDYERLGKEFAKLPAPVVTPRTINKINQENGLTEVRSKV